MWRLLLLHPFNGLFSRITWVSWYQKSKTSLDLIETQLLLEDVQYVMQHDGDWSASECDVVS